MKVEAVVGLTPGYNHNNEISELDGVIRFLKDTSEVMYSETGIYISWEVSPTTIIYREEWGCPKDGEKCCRIQAVCNEEYVKDTGKWKKVVLDILSKLRLWGGQVTLLVSFIETENILLK